MFSVLSRRHRPLGTHCTYAAAKSYRGQLPHDAQLPTAPADLGGGHLTRGAHAVAASADLGPGHNCDGPQFAVARSESSRGHSRCASQTSSAPQSLGGHTTHAISSRHRSPAAALARRQAARDHHSSSATGNLASSQNSCELAKTFPPLADLRSGQLAHANTQPAVARADTFTPASKDSLQPELERRGFLAAVHSECALPTEPRPAASIFTSHSIRKNHSIRGGES